MLFVPFCGYPRDQWRKIMKVHWLKDADAALTEANISKKPLLIDFSAAPA